MKKEKALDLYKNPKRKQKNVRTVSIKKYAEAVAGGPEFIIQKLILTKAISVRDTSCFLTTAMIKSLIFQIRLKHVSRRKLIGKFRCFYI